MANILILGAGAMGSAFTFPCIDNKHKVILCEPYNNFLIKKIKSKINLLFKDFNAEFLKRAEGDVHFECNEGDKIKALVDKVIKTKTRCNEIINVVAYVPSKLQDEPVAKFKLTLSLK